MLRPVLILTFLVIRLVYGTEEQFADGESVENAARIAPRQQSSNAKPMMDRLHAQYMGNTRAALSSSRGACTADNIAVRKEWGNMSGSEKAGFISAIQCLNEMPGKSPRDLSADARNRWDDFTVIHNINTPSIHWSGLMMPWHRHYLWEMERTLKTECGYQGYLPYWDYAKYLGGPVNQNPLFDGSQSSIGGDGTGPNDCVEDGPFANFTVNMPPPDESAQQQQRNPRCIKRSFSAGIMEQYANYERITDLIQNSADIFAFHGQLEGPEGLHVNPHSYIGGLQNNIYLSSQDPWFFFHHAMIDRVWAIWQSLDFGRRTLALDPTTNFDSRARLNFGPLPPATLDTPLYLSPIFQNVTLRDAMSPTSGSYCYMYD